jgi:hypothetical protein
MLINRRGLEAEQVELLRRRAHLVAIVRGSSAFDSFEQQQARQAARRQLAEVDARILQVRQQLGALTSDRDRLPRWRGSKPRPPRSRGRCAACRASARARSVILTAGDDNAEP